MTFHPEEPLELVVFKDDQVIIDVKVSSGEETVWLTQAQMARLFDNTPQNITMHIRNIYQEGELEPDSTCKDFLQVRNEGGRSVSRKSRHYNLDMIISVGYRVKSNRGIVFRKWANRILKEYLLHGVVMDRSRMEAEKFQQITQILKRSVMILESRQILDVIETYSRALTLLDDYDHGRILKVEGVRSLVKLEYRECRELIDEMQARQSSKLFGVEKDDSFRSSLSTIHATFDGKDVYPSVQEKAANLLYLIVKNHSFVDGNKRIAATMFLVFLNKNQALFKHQTEKVIADDTLAALTIMIAESNPQEKEVMTNLVSRCLIV